MNHSVTSLPDGYKQIYSVDLQKNKKSALIVNIAALAIMIIMAVPAAILVPLSELFSFEHGIIDYILRVAVLIIAMIAYIILHELVHGIFMRLFSKIRPKYGFTGLYAYAGSTAYFDKQSYIIIALAPVVIWGAVLAIICAVCPKPWFWVFYLVEMMNVSGAAGDFFVTIKFMKMPKDILVNDTGVAMSVFSKS